MDPAHLISPPRAHPSGISSGESIHGESILNETWFMIAIVIVLVVFLVSTAFTLRFLYRRRKNLSKGLQHLSGESEHRNIMSCKILLSRIEKSDTCQVAQSCHFFLFLTVFEGFK
jgi:Na+/H+ antiporter NhaD/arsenite permease-like protein